MVTEHEIITCINQLSGAFPDRKFDDKLILAYRAGLDDLQAGYLYLATQEIIKTAKFFPRISELREAHDRLWHAKGRVTLTYDGELIEQLIKTHGRDGVNRPGELTAKQKAYEAERRAYHIEMGDYVRKVAL